MTAPMRIARLGAEHAHAYKVLRDEALRSAPEAFAYGLLPRGIVVAGIGYDKLHMVRLLPSSPLFVPV